MAKFLVRIARDIESVEVQQLTVEAPSATEAVDLALARVDDNAWSIDEFEQSAPYAFLTMIVPGGN